MEVEPFYPTFAEIEKHTQDHRFEIHVEGFNDTEINVKKPLENIKMSFYGVQDYLWIA